MRIDIKRAAGSQDQFFKLGKGKGTFSGLSHPAGAPVRAERNADGRDLNLMAEPHAMDKLGDAGDAESADIRVLPFELPEKLLHIDRHRYVGMDSIFLHEYPAEMDVTVFCARHAHLFHITGDGFAARPEIAQAVGDEREPVRTIFELLLVHPVRELYFADALWS